MGGLCSCFRGPDDVEQDRATFVESNSRHGTNTNCLQFLFEHNFLFQRRNVRPISSPNHGRASVFPSSIDDSSICDTYRAPPHPLAFDDPRCSLFQPQSQTNASTLGKVSSHCHEACEPGRSNDVCDATKGLKKSDIFRGFKKKLSETSAEQPPKQIISGFTYTFPQNEDEDVCPTCLEEYTLENPKIALLCSHHFHLSCIYEWMERSNKCPFCGKVMFFNESQ